MTDYDSTSRPATSGVGDAAPRAPSAAAALVASRTSGEDSGLYRLLVESVLDDAIFALAAGGHIMTWNAGARRLEGYEPHEIIGRHLSTFPPPEDIASDEPGVPSHRCPGHGATFMLELPAVALAPTG